ncbi:MAG: phosphate ABC transporter permease PstA [Proteobacteria bacterium]|nr:MAG: phosphate ABC transporter permease PstA [Pseudomonadota bacterium]MBC6944289.1 phosphate ABC transporter permease PtsA [Gammaproteobacteria bacterium]MCE7896239.1 phosphate ABC transporter permease PstA [Gammaproteobacteria bacterium PRO8]MDL1879454.1 phosphate ABC transporter permease PstA [Gammaproteobacteria bacterium PRO2]MCL4777622.1 phosphate ABC transporter permease PstA [Gammaproteobacteria bacterium]
MNTELQPPDRNLASAQVRQIVEAGLARRYRRERRFRAYGLLSVVSGVLFLGFLLATIALNGYSAFRQTKLQLDLDLDPVVLGLGDGADAGVLASADYQAVVKASLGRLFPQVVGRKERRELNALVSASAGYILRDMVVAHPELVGRRITAWLPADDTVDMLFKGRVGRGPDAGGQLNQAQLAWVDELIADGRIALRFNTAFFTNGDSREPEMAGIWGGTKGSFFMLLVTLVLSFPLGVSAAIYLEEFAPRNRWVDFIEVNINNLAAVPSIVFGLLGLAVFINFFGLPRSAPLVGGLVLSLMTLPVIIIASRAALRAVPPSVREAALGIGSSPMQMVFHHVLPLAMPGMLTGAIIGMARALGESAPLLMVGMVAFIVDVPSTPLDPATVLPVQIYLWADSPERAFAERTSAAILVLLGFLLVMNMAAVWLRSRFERHW